MKVGVYSVLDVGTSHYHSPYVARNDVEARRIFESLGSKGDSLLVKYPEDYQLFRIGSFDDSDGALEGQTPRLACKGVDVFPKVVGKELR